MHHSTIEAPDTKLFHVSLLHTQKRMQVNIRNIVLVVKFTTTTFFLYINLKFFF